MTYSLFEVYGVELEYAVVRSGDLAAAPVVDRLLTALAGSPDGHPASGNVEADNELAAHVLELKCRRPVPFLAPQARDFQGMVTRMNTALAAMDAMLMPTGAHPFMDPATESRLWPHEGREIYTAYDRIFGCRGHGWFNLQSVHLNLPFSGDAEFSRLHNAISLLLPLMPALAASTPVLEGARHGWKDARLFHYLENQRRFPAIIGPAVPEPVNGEQEYREKILAPMYAQVAALDPEGLLQEEWLNSRAAIARFERMAIEIRCLDTQECPRADLALCFFLSRAIKRLVESGADLYGIHRRLPAGSLRALFVSAARDGLDTPLPGEYPQELFALPGTAGSIRGLLRLLFGEVEASGEEPAEFLPVLEGMLEKGSLADRIIRAGEQGAPWPDIYRELCDCLDKGRLFRP